MIVDGYEKEHMRKHENLNVSTYWRRGIEQMEQNKLDKMESERIERVSAINFKEFGRSIKNCTDEQQSVVARQIKTSVLLIELTRRLTDAESKVEAIEKITQLHDTNSKHEVMENITKAVK